MVNGMLNGGQNFEFRNMISKFWRGIFMNRWKHCENHIWMKQFVEHWFTYLTNNNLEKCFWMNILQLFILTRLTKISR